MKFDVFSDELKCRNFSYWNSKSIYQSDFIMILNTVKPQIKAHAFQVFSVLQVHLMFPAEVPHAHLIYEGHLESKERFAIKKYLLIIGKKKNMQVLSHTFTYFST